MTETITNLLLLGGICFFIGSLLGWLLSRYLVRLYAKRDALEALGKSGIVKLKPHKTTMDIPLTRGMVLYLYCGLVDGVVRKHTPTYNALYDILSKAYTSPYWTEKEKE